MVNNGIQRNLRESKPLETVVKVYPFTPSPQIHLFPLKSQSGPQRNAVTGFGVAGGVCLFGFFWP